MASGTGREANYRSGFLNALISTAIAMVFLAIVLTLLVPVFASAIANQRAAKMGGIKIDNVKSAAPATVPDLPAPQQAPGGPTGGAIPRHLPSVLKGDLRVAVEPHISFFEDQGVAFFRAMLLRNFLMKKDVARDNAMFSIEDDPGATEGLVVGSVSKAGVL